MSKWSDRDNYFVSPRSEVYSVVDLSSDPLTWVRRRDVTYDGPDDKDFKSLLALNDFAVNRQRKVIVRLRERNDPENDDFLQVERMVQEMKELKSLLKENGVQNVKELKSLVDNTKADLAKKSTDVEALQRKILDWNSDELRLTLEAIAAAMKKVFVDFADLKAPPASTDGDPKPVLEFLQKLRDLIVGKGFGDTFLGDANKILASIATNFNQRNGLSINGMVSTSTRTPADLIQDLNSLKTFVENRFFIDGTVIVKSYGLMKEQDIPAIFRNIEVGEAELKLKDKGTISIDNMDGGGNGKSSDRIFYGYFNIPSIGKFKGMLTRDDFTMPNEVTVKLGHRPYNLDENKFWFVKSNGEAIFEKSLTPPPPESEGNICKPEKVFFDSKRVLVGWVLRGSGDILAFLLRMCGKTFVNRDKKYLKFELTPVLISGPPQIKDDSVHYYDFWGELTDPFSRVQFDKNETAPDHIPEGQVSISLELYPESSGINRMRKFNDVLLGCLGTGHAFVYKNICLVGNITEAPPPPGADFRNNAVVSVFFEQFQPGQDCYVDALGTTFFVCNPSVKYFANKPSQSPKLLL